MQKRYFHKDDPVTERVDSVAGDEPKEWTVDELHEGAQEYVNENGEFTYEPPETQKEVDWSAREAEIEEAINDDFDRTYADYEKGQPFYKRWWFWLIAVLLVLAIVAAVLFKTGHMPGQFQNEETTHTTAVTEVQLEGPQVDARDFVLPDGAEVIEGDEGWGVYMDDALVPSYNGIASNQLGTWYIRDGLVDFTYTGYINVNGNTYKVTEGKVDVSNPIISSANAGDNRTSSNSSANSDSNTVGTTAVSAAQAPQSQDYAEGTESQQDALASAVDYINQMAFSRDWLIAQLVADGVDENDAAWAADHVGANWNEQAYKKAQEYLRLTSFGHSDMVDQLLFEGFTADQAEYGATKAGL